MVSRVIRQQLILWTVLLCFLVIGLALPTPLAAQEGETGPASVDTTLTWQTFLGGASDDQGNRVAVDSNGNVYVVGVSRATWGSPIEAFEGDYDAFVAKLNSSGVLQWHTFLGGVSSDSGLGITVDSSGVYVVGSSYFSWGSPVRPHAGQGTSDAFVAKLNSNGALLWNTFLGGANHDWAFGIARDSFNGEIYVTGISAASWGSPVRAYSGGDDVFVAKLNSSGNLQMHTFLGSASEDWAADLAIDSNAVYVVGHSTATWGSPVRAFSDGRDAFIARLNGSLTLMWNTFYGAVGEDRGLDIVTDGSSAAVVVGYSSAPWGNAVNRFNGNEDIFVARVNGITGALSWNTFLGSDGFERGSAIARDSSGNFYVAGRSGGVWGPSPRGENEYVFGAKLNSSGILQTNAFFGSFNTDNAYGIGLDAAGNMVIAGVSSNTWGSPIRAYSGQVDTFVVKLPAFGSRIGQSIGSVWSNPGSINISATAQVVATATSGLPVRVTVSGPCSAQGTTVYGLDPGGICTIVVHQDGNAIYASAPDSFTTLSVRLAQTIDFVQPANKTFGDAPFTLNATASSGLPVAFMSNSPSFCTVSGSTVTLVGVGTCAILASQAGDNTYSPSLGVGRNFTIQKAAQTITFNALPNRTLGAAPFTVSATASSGLAVAFASSTTAVCTVSGNTVTLKAVGTCTIIASQAGNGNYNAATSVNRSFQVSAAPPATFKLFVPFVKR